MKIRAENLLFSRRSWLSITNKNIFQKPVLTSQSKWSKIYLIMLFFFINLLDRYFFFLKVMFYINVINRITVNFIK